MTEEDQSNRARLIPTVEETAVGATADTPGIEPGLARGSLSTFQIVFMVMAAIAPAAGAVGLLPLAIGLGVGVGTPGVILMTGVVLLCFAVGFTRMVPFVRNAGAFYAFVRKGLGRTAGLVAAFLALSAYIAICSAVVGGFAFFAQITFADYGFDLPWPVWAVIGVVAVAVLAYFRVNIAAHVLTVLFLAEALVILVIDIGILFTEGLGDFGALPVFSPSNIFVASGIGVSLMFAFAFFQGFEGTAIYAEEAKDPVRTVPRATYIAISCITVWYVFTTWSFLVGGGGTKAPQEALANPGTFVFALSDNYVSSAWTTLLELLIVTSMFAGMLAFHNAAIRYMFSLARDGFLPAPLGRIHPRHKSPTVAGGVNALIVGAISLGFAAAGLDPLTSLSSAMTGFGAVGLLTLVTTTSIAAAVFFWRSGKRDLVHVGMPILGTLGVGTGLVLSLNNYSFMTGTDDAIVNNLPWLHLVTVVVVVGLATRVRRNNPMRWEKAGGDRLEKTSV